MNSRQIAAREYKMYLLAEVEAQRIQLRQSLHELRHPFSGRDVQQAVLRDLLNIGLSIRPFVAVGAAVGGIFIFRYATRRWSRPIKMIRLAFQVWSIGRTAINVLR